MDNKMLGPIEKKYEIKLKTGLHIGGSQGGLKIGGIDNAVVKNPLTGKPYIPGSSIKGKIRSLLEMIDYSEQLQKDKNGNIRPIQDPECDVAKAFGCAGDTKISSKLIFENFYLSQESDKKFEEKKSEFFEDKAENTIPRFLSGLANLRHIERVPAGVVFEGKIILLPHTGEYGMNQEELENILNKGIEYLNQTFLGGGGSRGNGRVYMYEINS